MDSPLDLEVENEFENRNVIGGLDRLILNVGLAILAVVPTFIILIAMPWRAAPLLAGEHAEGRQGAILGPGVFFVAALLAGYSLTALINPPDPVAVTEPASEIAAAGEAIGETAATAEEQDRPGMNSSIRSRLMASIAEGNVWKIASLFFPMFVVACGIAALSSGVGSLVLRVKEWTLRAATGASLYYLTTLIVFVLMVSVIDDYVLPPFEERSTFQVAMLGLSVFVGGVALLPWQFFWFFKGYTGQRAHTSGIHALVLSATIAVCAFSLALWQASRSFSEEASAEPASVEAVENMETAPVDTTPGEATEALSEENPE